MENLRGLWWVGMVLAGSGLSAASDDSELSRFEFSQVHMGGAVRLVVFAPDRGAAAEACEAAFARMAELEASMSDYRADSEISELHRRAGEGPLPVSEDLFRVLEAAQALAERSGGAFDVTAGALTWLWRDARRRGEIPATDEIAAARERVGWKDLVLDAGAGTAELRQPGMRLDLGGIAKGYAGDEALRVLARWGIDRALYQAGGDIVVSGPPPGAAGWRVQIVAEEAGAPWRTIEVFHAGVSTSGDTEQFLLSDGKRYSHVIDPRTGMGVTSRVMAAVVARDGLTADSLATLATVFEPDEMRSLVSEFYGETRIIIRRLDTPEPGGDPVDPRNR